MTYDADADANDLPPAVARAAEQWRPDYEPPPPPSGGWTPDELAEIARDLDAGPDLDPDERAALDAWLDSLTNADAPREPSADERATLPGGTLRDRLVSGVDILNIPEPVWMVDGVLPGQAITTLIGAPGCGKSFLALDLALSVLTNRPWQGRKMTADPTRSVLWLAGEGLHEVGKRTRAWCAHYDENADKVVSRLHVLHGGLAMQNPQDAAALIALVADLNPQLIVIDTLARHLVGGEENSGTDMSQLVDTAERLAQLDSAVLMVHHTGKDVSKGGRGHSSLLGAIRSELTVKGSDGTILVSHTKSNNSATDHGWHSQLTPAGIDPTTGGTLSMVPVVTSGPPPAAKAGAAVDLMLDALDMLDHGEGVTYTKWRTTCVDPDDETQPTISGSAFDHTLRMLRDNHPRVAKENGKNGRWHYVPETPNVMEF